MEKNRGEFNVVVSSENNLKVYRNSERVLILFILEAGDGRFKVCLGVGDKTKSPVGQHSWELYSTSSREQAEQAVSTLCTILDHMLDYDDGDYTIRGTFDRP